MPNNILTGCPTLLTCRRCSVTELLPTRIDTYIYISLDRCIGALRDTGFLAPLYLQNRGALHPIEKKGKRERKKEEGEGEGKEKEKLVPQHVARLDARETIRGSGINCRRIGVRAMSDEALIGEPTWPRLATIGNDIVPPFSYVHTYTYFTYREREREREVDSFSMKKATFDKRARQYRDTPSTILLLLLLLSLSTEVSIVSLRRRVPPRDVMKPGSFWFPGIVYCEFSGEPGPSERSVAS